ncbi:AGE family epimerase/isomerase [Oxalobacteraceae bacterium]|nr:AGE family epimerase/isomerase [Oxalobacteraceae bacterium]
MIAVPDFHARADVRKHIQETMQFYHPHCIDPDGGFYHFYKDDGRIYDTRTRHLVSSTRFVFTYAMAARQLDGVGSLEQVRHGLRFLREAHRNPATGGYAWQIDRHEGQTTVLDGSNHCYGLAFVLLAYSHALMAGAGEAREFIGETFELMERRFWQADDGLYADEASADWATLDGYRGQNANMHSVEALLAAYEATQELRYLHRAELIAHNITVRQANLADGLIWEHYKTDWSVDWDYNRDDASNIFRPWGFQPGHLTEWSKLLLIMERYADKLQRPSDWILPRAEALFNAGLDTAWDKEHGGIFYGFAPDGAICDGDKYHWVQAESLATAAVLGKRTGEAKYWDWYDRMWEYCWAHFVDHKNGAWFRILRADNSACTEDKSPAGKVDYHNMGACYEILNTLSR